MIRVLNISARHKVDCAEINKQTLEVLENNRRDLKRRIRLRNKRLQRINDYQQEQIAALKH